METVSRPAKKLLKSLMRVRNNSDYVIYDDHSKLIDSDELAIDELVELNFLVQDFAGNFRITRKGLIFLRQYKTFSRQAWLTSFWIPLAVSVIGTVLTLVIENWLFKN